MPEGDTIFRAATSLRAWIGDRVITGATARDQRLRIDRLIGRRLAEVSTHGKHLFLEFEHVEPDGQAAELPAPSTTPGSLVLRTHMMMTGSWHVYGVGDRWRKPQREAVVTLLAGERTAVCFNAPVVELLSKRRSEQVRSKTSLGPDILCEILDIPEITRRAASLDGTVPIAVLLLDQHVVAGIGNIYRSESLFLERINPVVPHGALGQNQFEALLRRASLLMRSNLSTSTHSTRSFGDSSPRPWVYGRSGLPCRRCRTLIESDKLGVQARTAFWCPSCQPLLSRLA